MSQKKRAAAENNLKNGSDALEKLQNTYSEEAAKRFVDIQETADDASKILKLRDARRYIERATREVSEKVDALSREHVLKYRSASRKFRDAMGAEVYIYTERHRQDKAVVAKQLKEAAGTESFLNDLKELEQNIEVALAATVRNCDLREISGSPYFADAYKQHEPLRDRFAAATAARAALGEGTRAEAGEEKKPEIEKKPANDTLKDPEAKPEKQKINSYDHLKRLAPPKNKPQP